MKQFEKGWWNCFLSYTDNLAYYSTRGDGKEVALIQLKEAGIPKKEVDRALKEMSMSERTKQILTGYKESL